MVTGYQRAFATQGDLQHLLPGAWHAFPQQPPPFPRHGKLSPKTLSQQTSSLLTQLSPQQAPPSSHSNSSPLLFVHCTDTSLHSMSLLMGYHALFGLAALAAWRRACVSAAPTTLSLAWKAVPIDILAADIMLAHTGTAAALVASSAFKAGSVVIPALHRRLATS